MKFIAEAVAVATMMMMGVTVVDGRVAGSEKTNEERRTQIIFPTEDSEDVSCEFTVAMQGEDEVIPAAPGWHPEGNIVVTLPDPAECEVASSPTWTVGGWEHTWIQLAPGATFSVPELASDARMAVKILRGTLMDIGVNGVHREDGRWETYVVYPPNRPVSLWLDSSLTEIEAGEMGAAFLFFHVTTDVLSMTVTDMNSGPPTMLAGPMIDQLEWVQFGDYYDVFAEIEFYNFAGLYFQEYDHERLAYFQWWTFREDMDADGYHNHANLDSGNTFAELHMAMFSCTGTSGMQTALPDTLDTLSVPNPDVITTADGNRYFQNDQPEVQMSIPLAPGYAHGPLWSVEPDTGMPTLDCDGGVVYPFHRMLGGAGYGNEGFHTPPRYTLWIAFEHPPVHTTIPSTMLTYWRNAYLQSTMRSVPYPDAC